MHIQINEKRHCVKCGFITEQVCHKLRYEDNPSEPGTLVKRSYWVCPTCFAETEEVKTQLLPSDKVRIIDRLLRMQGDYSILSMNISSRPERLLVEITVKD